MKLNNIEVNIIAEIELIDAYNKNIPSNFIDNNVIYCIHNKVNEKNYIGQTVKFRNRFSITYVGHFRDYNRYIEGEFNDSRALYRAWKKYGLESFIVYIIDICDSRDSLNEREVYWIKTLHTCTKDPECLGYNLTWGADDMGVNCRESIQRSLETRRKMYGNAFANCHTQEALDKGNKTKIERYGHGGFVNAFTPEANEKRRQTNIKKFGTELGTLKIIWENNIKKYGNKLGSAHLPENRKKGNFNKRINLCIKRINSIISSSKELITTWDQYKKLIPLNFVKPDSIKGHLKNLKELLPHIKQSKYWTPIFNNIFSDLIKMTDEEFNNLTKELLNSKRKSPEEKQKKNKKANITKMFKTIDRLLTKRTTKVINWNDYCKLVFSEYSGLHDAYKHLDKLIDLLPDLKLSPKWNETYEKLFGNLTPDDKVKRKINRRK